MSSLPCIPDTAPFTPEQRLWLDGYLAGLFSRTGPPASGTATAPAPPPVIPLTILYGTQTGSAAGLAKKIAAAAKKRSLQPKVVDMAAAAAMDLTLEANLLIVTSTYGDGEMPDNAQSFWELLASDQAPKLDRTRYSVLALGDTNYAKFCQAGKDFDFRLESLGAQRLHPRVDCDVDYDEPAALWMEAVLTALSSSSPPVAGGAVSGGPLDDEPEATGSGSGAPVWNRKNPFPARLVANRLLSAAGSGKEVRHFEFDLTGSGLSYESGDALGVMPQNCPALVEEMLVVLGASGEEPCQEVTLREALLTRYDLTKPSPELLALSGLSLRLGEALPQWLYGRDVLDVLGECQPAPSLQELPTLFRKLQPRLYSISSSPRAHAGRVHLTVGAVRYESHGRARQGVCSTFLADRAEAGRVPIFFHSSPGFRLPSDGSRPVIMVGPGTGIAPFRSFLHERAASGATGGNWLFFGEQHASTDYYYRSELLELQDQGVLTRLDTAFSRDQEKKIYVQDRMMEHAVELHQWLENGAHFYVCGDASRMARDVDAALHRIFQSAGGLTTEESQNKVRQLKSEGRYQRDVY